MLQFVLGKIRQFAKNSHTCWRFKVVRQQVHYRKNTHTHTTHPYPPEVVSCARLASETSSSGRGFLAARTRTTLAPGALQKAECSRKKAIVAVCEALYAAARARGRPPPVVDVVPHFCALRPKDIAIAVWAGARLSIATASTVEVAAMRATGFGVQRKAGNFRIYAALHYFSDSSHSHFFSLRSPTIPELKFIVWRHVHENQEI